MILCHSQFPRKQKKGSRRQNDFDKIVCDIGGKRRKKQVQKSGQRELSRQDIAGDAMQKRCLCILREKGVCVSEHLILRLKQVEIICDRNAGKLLSRNGINRNNKDHKQPHQDRRIVLLPLSDFSVHTGTVSP